MRFHSERISWARVHAALLLIARDATAAHARFVSSGCVVGSCFLCTSGSLNRYGEKEVRDDDIRNNIDEIILCIRSKLLTNPDAQVLLEQYRELRSVIG